MNEDKLLFQICAACETTWPAMPLCDSCRHNQLAIEILRACRAAPGQQTLSGRVIGENGLPMCGCDQLAAQKKILEAIKEKTPKLSM